MKCNDRLFSNDQIVDFRSFRQSSNLEHELKNLHHQLKSCLARIEDVNRIVFAVRLHTRSSRLGAKQRTIVRRSTSSSVSTFERRKSTGLFFVWEEKMCRWNRTCRSNDVSISRSNFEKSSRNLLISSQVFCEGCFCRLTWTKTFLCMMIDFAVFACLGWNACWIFDQTSAKTSERSRHARR